MGTLMQAKKTLNHLYSTYRDAYKALPRHPFGKSDSCLQAKTKAVPVTQYGSGQMTRTLRYRTVLLAQTGICSGIHPMGLRSIPPQSLASSTSASMTSSPQWMYVHIPTRSHGLQVTPALSYSLELLLSRSWTLIQTLKKSLDEPSNRQSINIV